MTLHHAFVMLWETFWALVMGFGVSAALQTFVSEEQMSRAFGRTNLKTMGLATGLGAASSSCSYAAAVSMSRWLCPASLSTCFLLGWVSFPQARDRRALSSVRA